MDNLNNLNARLTLALVCALTLFPVAFALLALGGLMVAQDLRILDEVPVVFYVALAAGVGFVGFGMFALTAQTTARGRVLGWLALVSLVICMATGIAALHGLGDGCPGSSRTGLGCSDD